MNTVRVTEYRKHGSTRRARECAFSDMRNDGISVDATVLKSSPSRIKKLMPPVTTVPIDEIQEKHIIFTKDYYDPDIMTSIPDICHIKIPNREELQAAQKRFYDCELEQMKVDQAKRLKQHELNIEKQQAEQLEKRKSESYKGPGNKNLKKGQRNPYYPQKYLYCCACGEKFIPNKKKGNRTCSTICARTVLSLSEYLVSENNIAWEREVLTEKTQTIKYNDLTQDLARQTIGILSKYFDYKYNEIIDALEAINPFVCLKGDNLWVNNIYKEAIELKIKHPGKSLRELWPQPDPVVVLKPRAKVKTIVRVKDAVGARQVKKLKALGHKNIVFNGSSIKFFDVNLKKKRTIFMIGGSDKWTETKDN